MKTKIQSYHAVSNEEGVVLAVYGAALLSMAQEEARVIESHTGCRTHLHHGVGPKPSVGQSISMRGIKHD